MRFVAENPSADRLLGAEPKNEERGRTEERGKRKTKAAELHFFGGLDLFQVALGEA